MEKATHDTVECAKTSTTIDLQMRIGQTSIISFIAQILASVLGFVATIYFSRALGAEVIGIYAVIMATVGWIHLAGNIGVGTAAEKRISEGIERGKYMSASIILSGSLTFLALAVLFIIHNYVESYIGDFGTYSPVSVVWVIAILVIANWLRGYTRVFLNATHKVHISATLKTVQTAFRSIIQIALVVVGYSLIGMLTGYALGACLVAVVGFAFLSLRPKIPSREHFSSLISYAKYSWGGGLQSRVYNDVDLLLLGAFVSSSLVGVYSVAWTITKFLHIFGIAISTALFPEISKISKQESREAATGLIEDSIAYGGLIIIPGLVGGVLLKDRLFQIYGQEFTQGVEVFPLLLLSMLFYTYMQQLLNAVNATDRPDIAFWTNITLLGTNVILNVVLIWHIGWVGAAVASAVSTLLGLVLIYTLFSRIMTIQIPVKNIGYQVGAALCMGGTVWTIERLIEELSLIQHNFMIAIGLVTIGAGSYVLVLLLISTQFRQIVSRNLPID